MKPTTPRRAFPWATALGSLLLAACAHGPQPIRLHPAPDVAASGLGGGIRVALTVVDRRPDTSATEMPSAVQARRQFPIQDDLLASVRQQVTEGLRRQGFSLAPTAPTSLTVAIERFDYWVLTGFGTSDVRATAVLHAVARREGTSFEVTYKADHHQRVAIAPRKADVEGAVNGALEVGLRQLFEDRKLLDFLAEGD